MRALFHAVLAAGLLLAPVAALGQEGPQKTEKVKNKDQQKDKADKAKTFQIGQEVDRVALRDMEGKVHKVADFRGKVVVLDFWSIDCPVSRAYEARLKKLYETYAPKDVVFLAVDANTTEVDRGSDQPYARIEKYVKDNSIPYKILIDDHNWVADRFDAKTTPHVYVLDQKGVLRYAGAIDDDPKGEMGDKATNHVAAALDAVLAGKEVAVTTTKPKGCTIKRVTPEEQKTWREEHKKKQKDKGGNEGTDEP